jgi:hypothetical protein
MTENTLIATLTETRKAKTEIEGHLAALEDRRRRLQAELAQVEAKTNELISQLSSFNQLIEQTELAVRRTIFGEGYGSPPRREQRYDAPRYESPRYDAPRHEPRHDVPRHDLLPSYESRPELRPDHRYEGPGYREPEPPAHYRPVEPALRAADIDAEVESATRDEQSSNVRFADFRIPQAATIVLREARRPLHVSEIYRRLAEGGFEFRGQHQLITLAVSLSRSKRFRKVQPGTFELAPEFQSGQVA